MDEKTRKVLVRVDAKYFRPAEVEYVVSLFFALAWLLTNAFVRLLLGNPVKAEKKLRWKRKCPFDELVREMVSEDLEASKSLVENQNLM